MEIICALLFFPPVNCIVVPIFSSSCKYINLYNGLRGQLAKFSTHIIIPYYVYKVNLSDCHTLLAIAFSTYIYLFFIIIKPICTFDFLIRVICFYRKKFEFFISYFVTCHYIQSTFNKTIYKKHYCW